jgi:hypothetical protein
VRVLVQFAAEQGELAPVVEIDHRAWADLPADVYVNALCIQGMWIKGCDHYTVIDDEGVPVVIAWCDDPAQWDGERWGQRIRFPPLFADTRFGGRLNTRIEIEIFAEGAAYGAWARANPATKRFRDLDLPSGRGVRSGVQLSDARFYAHVAALPRVHFREWSD